MRVIVISDTHRDFRTLRRIVDKHRGEAGLFLHLGDGAREIDDLLALYPGLPLEAVRGNCDFASRWPVTHVTLAEDVKIFLCHGYTFRSVDEITAQARNNGCRIALYGHTHRGETHYDEGIYVMNPGSPSCPRNGRASYGVIDVTPSGSMTFLVEI